VRLAIDNKGWLIGLAGSLLPFSAFAQEVADRPSETIIVTAPGGGIDRDDALSVERKQVWAAGSPDMLASLTREIVGVTF
jgi:iron complex outermembrane recepter protein